MTDTTKPVPCHWCKSSMVPYQVGSSEHYLRCSNAFKCDAQSPTRDTPEAAIAAWNSLARVWQPIETAPRDGTPYIVGRSDDYARVARYMTSLDEGDGAWVIARRVGFDPVAVVYQDPTHWQPLPAAPDNPDAEGAA